MSRTMTRRAFLASSAGAAALVSASASAAPMSSSTSPLPEPTGPVYARTDPGGLPPGSPHSPSVGRAILRDGRTLEVSHHTAWRIGGDKGVLLAPDLSGRWTIVYAEV